MKIKRIHHLDHLTNEDQTKFWKFGRGKEAELSFNTVHEAMEAQARERSDAIAVIHNSDRLTYGQLDHIGDVLADKLSKLGCGQGENVGLFIERSIPMVIGIFGILKSGAAYVPQDARITPIGQLRHIVETSDIKVILTLSHLRHRIPTSMGQTVIALDEILPGLAASGKKKKKPVECDSGCFVLYTSGTTGFPNGVKVSHKNVCNIIHTAPGNLNIQPGQKVSQLLNISFDMAAWEIFSTLSYGAVLVIREKSIAEAISKADVVIATPSILATVDPNKNRHVKTVAVAGEPCPKNLAEKWSEFSDFYNCCGPTETTIVNTMKLFVPTNEKISIGAPTPNNTVYILDENLEPLPIGEIGEMWAGGACVTKGYVKNAKLTHERYKKDPFLGGKAIMFRTRDLGRWNENGELEHFGRTDDQVKIKGFRVELDSVSTMLESFSECNQAVTIKLDSRNLVSFLTPRTVDIQRVEAFIKGKLPYYSLPSLIIPLNELPKTARGKIDKKTLTILAAKTQAKESEYEHGHRGNVVGAVL